LAERLSDWRELVERCGRKPGKKRVHALRVATLRIQAEVHEKLRDLPCASHEAQAILRFEKLAHKLRDALGAVRELDVWIGKLRGLSQSLSDTTEYVPRSTRETARQIERLETRLAKKRERAGSKLTKEIAKRQEDFLSVARDLERAADEKVDEADGEQASKLLKEFSEIMTEFPAFDQSNLHDFRKRIKKIRYVAEIYTSDPVCGQIAEQMKRAQGAVGEWHDWQVLAHIAGRGKHAKDVGAVELLNTIAAEAYETAISTCDGVVRWMADLKSERDNESQTVRKAPVRSESSESESVRKSA